MKYAMRTLCVGGYPYLFSRHEEWLTTVHDLGWRVVSVAYLGERQRSDTPAEYALFVLHNDNGGDLPDVP